MNCVASVRKHTPADICEIIVVDNGSTSEEARRLKNSLPEEIVFISLKENLFFGEGNNIGAEVARGKFLLFLNNDVTFEENVVERLLSDFKTSFSPGAIGPKFLYPNGTLQEAGAFIRPDGWTVQQGKGNLTLDAHFEQGCHIVDYCSAACLMVERTTFRQLGGFDPVFDPAYFEDCDLCLRMRSMGLFTYFSSNTSVVHEENATSAELWRNEKINEIAAKNHKTFIERWGPYLKTRLTEDMPFPAPVPPLPSDWQTTAELNGLKKIALCRPSILVDNEICSSMLRCAAALQSIYSITFAAAEICSALRIRSLGRNLQLHLSNFNMIRVSDLDEDQFDHVVWFADDFLPESNHLSSVPALRAYLNHSERRWLQRADAHIAGQIENFAGEGRIGDAGGEQGIAKRSILDSYDMGRDGTMCRQIADRLAALGRSS